MKRTSMAVIAFALVATSCGGGRQTRTVLVDYKHDQFASAFLSYFPNRVEAHPGDTIAFHQAWSGEPHSVTMGLFADRYGQHVKPYLKIFAAKGYAGLPEAEPAWAVKFDKENPWMVKDDNATVAQNGAQPCYLSRGMPPKNQDKPCTSAQQQQPDFNGRQNFYNSGFIPYEGPSGDTFEVKVAKDAKPGEHFFFCNYHGPFMSGFLVIKPKGTKISNAAASELANSQINTTSRVALKDYLEASRGRLEPAKDAIPDFRRLGFTKAAGRHTYLKGWFAGLRVEDSDSAEINEFIPRNLHAKVGEKLTWAIIGTHTISFNVPTYFPLIQVLPNGSVNRNPRLNRPAGGAPALPKAQQGNGPPPPPTVIDGGSWDGRGFWSSGLVESDNFSVYSLRITRPGSYRFACLIHPPMVGTLVVS